MGDKAAARPLFRLAKTSGRVVNRLLKPLRRAFKKSTWKDSALRELAAAYRLTYPRTTFICVTGSCGKTTTVVLAEGILSSSAKCHAVFERCLFAANTIWGLKRHTDFCIQELHAAHRGLMRNSLKVLRPQIGVVTTIGGDHFKLYRTVEATAREKRLLVESLPKNGVAVLNADDENVRAMATATRARVITYGRSSDADLRAVEVGAVWPDRLSFTATYGTQTARIETKLIGEHWLTSVLAAIGTGIASGIDLETAAESIKSCQPVFGRYSAHGRADGSVYILDSHKAPFWTIQYGLDFVRKARATRKTIIFGTISDYPGQASSRYRRVAREALDVAQRVIFVGPNSGFVDKLRHGELRNRLLTFPTPIQASTYLSHAIVPGELIYIKSSATADHLERLMLADLDQVVCWRRRCGKELPCHTCKNFHSPFIEEIEAVGPLAVDGAPLTV